MIVLNELENLSRALSWSIMLSSQKMEMWNVEHYDIIYT